MSGGDYALVSLHPPLRLLETKHELTLTEAKSGRSLAVLLRRFSRHRVHVVTLPGRQTWIEEIGFHGCELDALDSRVIETVRGRVQ